MKKSGAAHVTANTVTREMKTNWIIRRAVIALLARFAWGPKMVRLPLENKTMRAAVASLYRFNVIPSLRMIENIIFSPVGFPSSP